MLDVVCFTFWNEAAANFKVNYNTIGHTQNWSSTFFILAVNYENQAYLANLGTQVFCSCSHRCICEKGVCDFMFIEPIPKIKERWKKKSKSKSGIYIIMELNIKSQSPKVYISYI